MNRRFCLCMDLKDDPGLIEQYKHQHEPGNVWPEIIQSIYDSGVLDMEIYRCHNRLFMILEVDEAFSLERKAEMDAANEKTQEWESLMQQKFQQAVPWETQIKWVQTERIFKLKEHGDAGRGIYMKSV